MAFGCRLGDGVCVFVLGVRVGAGAGEGAEVYVVGGGEGGNACGGG